MASTLSTISRNRWAGFLEGIDGVAKDAIAEQRFERPAVHHVAHAIEDIVNIKLKPRIFENPHGPGLVEVHQHIDVAIRLGLPSRYGAKDCGMGHTEPS